MAAMTNTISAKLNRTISIRVMTTAVYLPTFVLCTQTASMITLPGAGRSWRKDAIRRVADRTGMTPAFAERPVSVMALWVQPRCTLRAILARRPSTKVIGTAGRVITVKTRCPYSSLPFGEAVALEV